MVFIDFIKMLHTMMLVFCTTPLDRPVTPRNSFMEKVCQSWQWGKNKLHEMAVNSVSKTDVIAGAAMCAMYYGWSQYQEQQPELENALADYVASGTTLFGMALSKNFYTSTVALAALLMPKVTACQPKFIGLHNMQDCPDRRMAISGDTILITENNGISLIDVSNPKNILVSGFYNITNIFTSVNPIISWPNAYISTTDDVMFLDISNPHNTREVGKYIRPDRHVVEDMTFSGHLTYLYSSYADGGLCIINTSNIKVPQLVGTLVLNITGYMLSAMVISGDIAYIPLDNMLNFVDIKDPANPKLLTQYETQEFPVIDFAVSNTTVYAINGNQLLLIDVSNPKIPKQINNYTSEIGYMFAIALSGDLLFTLGQGSVGVGDVAVLDVGNPKNIKQIGHIHGRGFGRMKQLIIKNHILFALQGSSLQTFDISSCL